MKKIVELLVIFTIAGTPWLCQAQSVLPRATESRNFQTGVISGWVRGDKVFESGQHRYVEIYLLSSRPAKFGCMDYADFRFQLVDQSGRLINSTAPTRLSGAAKPPMVGRASPAYSPGNVPPCWPSGDSLRSAGGFRFSLDSLYPNLAPGTYTLVITFAPRDRSEPITLLPSISFQIAA